MGRLTATLTAAALLLAGGAPGSAVAGETQILGVVASADPLPMTCAKGSCMADLSTFCMEEMAGVPVRGTPYRVAPGAALALEIVGHGPDGDVVRVPADGLARLTAVRGYRGVRVELSAAAVRALGITDPGVVVGPMVSLVPAADLAADDPETVQRIAAVTGPVRALARDVVEEGAPGTGAAILTNRLLNAIPDDRSGDVPDRLGLWREVSAHADVEPEARVLAEGAARRCAGLPGGGFITFRQCIAAEHDMFLTPLNRALWDAAGAGS
jgi:hypothetical protein